MLDKYSIAKAGNLDPEKVFVFPGPLELCFELNKLLLETNTTQNDCKQKIIGSIWYVGEYHIPTQKYFCMPISIISKLRNKSYRTAYFANFDKMNNKNKISHCKRCNIQNEYIEYNADYLCYSCRS